MILDLNLTLVKNAQKRWGKAKKAKDSAKKTRKAGRPRRRERSHSIPSSLTEEDWIANKEWITKNIKNKRNIDEIGSPEKNRNKIGREEKEEGRRVRKERR